MHEVRVLRAGLSPVKGTRHLDLPSLTFDEHGAVGDRRYCLVDVERRRVLRTVQHPGLVAVLAEEHDGELSLTLPDGGTVAGRPEPTGDTVVCDYWGRELPLTLLRGDHAELLSDHLGTRASLAEALPRGVIYGAGISIVTRGALDELAERCGHPVEPARFRATLVVDGADEELRPGHEVRVGNAVIRIGDGIGRCAVIDIGPNTGERGTSLLRTLATYRPRNEAGEPCFGWYAEVIRPGDLRVL